MGNSNSSYGHAFGKCVIIRHLDPWGKPEQSPIFIAYNPCRTTVEYTENPSLMTGLAVEVADMTGAAGSKACTVSNMSFWLYFFFEP